MELRQLKIFTAVAQELSFTKAAEILDYAQSNVTAQVKLLEAELGIKLFERLGKRIALTPDGEKMLRYATQILKFSAEAKDVITKSPTPRGTITVAVAESLCVFRLPGFFKEFCKRYPQVKLVLKLGTSPDFHRWLKDNTVDVAFFLDEKISAPDLIAETLRYEPMVVVGEAEHRLLAKGYLEPADISEECLILTECGCSYRTVLENILQDACIQPQSTLEFDSIEAIKQFAASGLGIALLPKATVETELRNRKMVDLIWQGPPIDMYTQVVYHKDKWMSPTLTALLDLLKNHSF